MGQENEAAGLTGLTHNRCSVSELIDEWVNSAMKSAWPVPSTSSESSERQMCPQPSGTCNSQSINDTGKEMRGGRELIISEAVEESSRASVFQEQRLMRRHLLDEEGGYLE